MNRADLRRRIKAISALVRPNHSLDAKLEKLTSEQRSAYRNWCDQMDRWHHDHPGDQAYLQMIWGDSVPTLRRDVSEALFGPRYVLPAASTERDVGEIYRRIALGD